MADRPSKKIVYLVGVKHGKILHSDDIMSGQIKESIPLHFTIKLKPLSEIESNHLAKCVNILGLPETYASFVKAIIQQFDRDNDFYDLLAGQRVTLDKIIEMIDYLRSEKYYLHYKGIDFSIIVVQEISFSNLDAPESRPTIHVGKPKEEFKPILGFEGRYEASKSGVIWDNFDGIVISDYNMPNTNLILVSLEKNGIFTEHHVNRLVMFTFQSHKYKVAANRVVNIDGDFRKNHLENLKWHISNHIDAIGGNHKTSPAAKFTERAIFNIRDSYFHFDWTIEDLAEKFKVEELVIKKIVYRNFYSKV